MLADGRLFRIRVSPWPPCVRLVGWDSPGDYWTARPAECGWRLSPSLAGCELGSIDEILLLLAAEILEAGAAV